MTYDQWKTTNREDEEREPDNWVACPRCDGIAVIDQGILCCTQCGLEEKNEPEQEQAS